MLSLLLLLFMIIFINLNTTNSNSRNIIAPQSANYRWVYQYINSTHVKSIFEVGSRDCKDGNNLAHHFNCQVYSFEANPDNYDDMMLI